MDSGYTRLKLSLMLTAVAVVMLLLMPRSAKFAYNYGRGSEWEYETLVAQVDFPILKSEEQLREEKSAAKQDVIPYFKHSDAVASECLEGLRKIDFVSSELQASVMSAARGIYAKGILSDAGGRDAASGVIYVQDGKQARIRPCSDVYSIPEAKAELLSSLAHIFPDVNLDSLFSENGVYDLLRPSLSFDQQMTELVHRDVHSYVPSTQGFVKSGQVIISKGDIVTSELEQILDSYKAEYEATVGHSSSPFSYWAGNAILATALALIVFFVVYFTNKSIIYDRRFAYIITVYLMFAAMTILALRHNAHLLYLVPFTLSALYLQAFFKTRVVFATYVSSLLPLLIFAPSGQELFIMFLLAGVVAIKVFNSFNKGWKQFITALVTFAILAVTYLGFRLTGRVSGDLFTDLTYLFLGSCFTVAAYPLIYLFEKLFNLVSASRLVELSDTSNSLLRELEKKAPGTFQHSLQVMNMSDVVARSIGADVLLVRTGALYHDVGKIVNPLCFVENESLLADSETSRYHATIPPQQSAKDIIRHVEDGVELARKHRVPEVIRDFIRSHHGTTEVAYFYNKYINEGGDPLRHHEFVYGGVKPKSKEQTILMLCDSIEAASRTLKSYSPEAISSFVDGIVDSKMSQGQFEDSKISISELSTVKSEIKQYLAQIHHERVVYPKLKNTSNDTK